MRAFATLRHLLRRYPWVRGADDRHGDYVSQRRHIVLGGCGRSGTTLARVILDSHRNICCGPESGLFRPRRIKLEKLERKFKIERPKLLAIYRVSRSRGEFIDQFADVCLTREGKQRWAEKTPRNALQLEYLFKRFPQARFVHVIRDGRDVACSLRTHPRHRVVNGQLVALNTWKPMQRCAQRWRDSLQAVLPFSADPRFYTLRYESLVADPRSTIRGLLEFLDEPWDEAMLEHQNARSNFRDATAFPQNPEALRPIETAPVRRWERDMTAEDRAIFKQVAGDLLIEQGYASDSNW